jgi:hypothetical protein
MSANDRQKKYQRKNKKKVFDHYGRVCVCCGEDEPLFLTIDHINNDGYAHRKEVGGGSGFYRWLVLNGFPAGFQTLCWNCNCGRRLNGGVCPHG